jgi:hypothetical protein
MTEQIKKESVEYRMRYGSFPKIIFGFFILITALVILILNSRTGVPDDKNVPVRNESPVYKRWYRGNTHTHTKFMDYFDKKDISVIASWYKEKEYDFLIITDHNTPDTGNKVICHEEVSDPPSFIMLCALELSKIRHLTALGIDKYIGDEKSLQDGVNKTIEAGGVPILNHPQYPVIRASEFITTKGLNHLEIYNHKRRKETAASEILWDSILSAPDGRIVYGVASDDNHHRWKKAGKGWIMVEAPYLAKETIKDNILRGNFYASTGIILKDYQIDQGNIIIDTENGSKISFIGYLGRVLSIVTSSRATYKPTGNEVYVRIKVTGADGKMAWTQPLFLK